MAHILIIDDDESLLTTLEVVLLQAGHTVTSASDGAAAAKVIRNRHCDVVLTDIVMPNRDGLETVVAMQQERPELRVIAMSGGTRRSGLYLDIAGKLGAQATLRKPFSADELLAAIDAALRPTAPP